MQDNIEIIRPKELCEKLHMSPNTIDRLIKENNFPRKIQLGSRAVGWRVSEINKWLDERTLEGYEIDGK
jgi:prophage regulatory protein